MEKLILFNKTDLDTVLSKRIGETKFGEQIKLLTDVTSIYDAIKKLDVNYVIFGIPEDIGVFSNNGKSGTYTAFDATIKILLNTQNNDLNNADKVLLLGHLDFTEELKQVKQLDQNLEKDIEKARKIVSTIDKEVSYLVQLIVSAGKIPIAIGGGHNNAYGLIKGTSLALKSPINAVNFDAHTDFRALEGRHSGNGFSYCFEEGFLKKYFVFGLHENYTSKSIFDVFNENKKLDFVTYEAIEVTNKITFKNALKQAKQHICGTNYGIEIDCDAIINTASSAKTSSGFSVKQTRQFLHYFGKRKNVKYLHICEAIATKKNKTEIGKLITYLITDFIKSRTIND